MDSKDWEPDSASATCRICNRKWGLFNYRRHHCRNCGKLVCFKCSGERMYLKITCKTPVRVCDKCVQSIRSKERPKLDQDDNLNEEDDDLEDHGSDCISVISDGKCKATERPFRNTLSDKNRPEVSRPEETPVIDDDFEEEKEGSVHENSHENPESLLQLEEAAINSLSHDKDTMQGKATFDSLRTDATGGSDGSEGTPLSLHQLHEASAPNLLKPSLQEEPVKRGLSLSKFGNMAFSDEESAGTTPFSTRESATVLESGNAEVSSVAATAGSPENVPADTVSNASSGPLLDASTDEQPAEADSHKTTNSNDEETAKGRNSSTASSDKPRPLYLTPKQGPVRMAKRKSTSPATLPAELPLAAGKSPMPTGSTVRRLSTYASAAAVDSADIATRTPFNSTVAPSPEAATAAVDTVTAAVESLNTIKEDAMESVTVPITSTEGESTVEPSSDNAAAGAGEEQEDAAVGEEAETEEGNKAQGRKGGKNRRKGRGKK